MHDADGWMKNTKFFFLNPLVDRIPGTTSLYWDLAENAEKLNLFGGIYHCCRVTKLRSKYSDTQLEDDRHSHRFWTHAGLRNYMVESH